MKNFRCTINVSDAKDCNKRQITVDFDCSNVSDEDLIEYAKRSIIIAHQAAIRAYQKTDKLKAFNELICNVPKPGGKSVADPINKLEGLLAKLSPEAREAFIIKVMAEN